MDGKDAALDVTVTSSLASSNLAAAADACREQGLVFFPIAFEALGGVHQVAVTQLKRLGAALARHSGSDEREVVSQLLQRISLHLMRGNSALISGRRPHPDPDLLVVCASSWSRAP